ncbi:ABC transporter ATP-binding protein [Streptococcaceae bacterium ESL0729]|nr:ABC transporter ATP-binding protein [Streptococcaceae bacterium ESL0729]
MAKEKEVVLRVTDVHKSFKLPVDMSNSLKVTVLNMLKGVKGYVKYDVLKGISFEVEKGDFFGIVGRNGSGKSTLLKIISQIYKPEKGNVEVFGKLVPFIELGVGFNPELTGRENVYMNGAMLGFSNEEIDGMYDDIVEFAELSEFMEQKLKNYSSGMQVRLAFSVAIKAQGDILVLDEVLAVGDEAFQRKCNDYFEERKKSGLTTILVTHSMEAVRKYCNKALLIDDGLVKTDGDPNDTANQYVLDNFYDVMPEYEAPENKYVEDLQVKLLNNSIIGPDEYVEFELSYTVTEDIKTYPAFSFVDIDRNFDLYNDNMMLDMTSGKGSFKFNYKCKLNAINNAKVRVAISIKSDKDDYLAFPENNDELVFVVRTDKFKDESEKDSAFGLLKRNGSWTHE